MQDEPTRNLSKYQFPWLAFIAKGYATMGNLRRAKGNTLFSLLHWQWIVARGDLWDEKTPVEITKAGTAALEAYTKAELSERNHEGDLTERCMSLLVKYSRRVRVMKKAG